MPLVVFGGVLAWWGWKSGGYFEVTYLPGTMILLGVVAAFLLFAPALGALRGAALVSLAGLVGLAAWTLISGSGLRCRPSPSRTLSAWSATSPPS